MPSESLLIINGRSLQAMQVANEYASLRHFPAERILVLHPELSFFRKVDGSPKWTVSQEQAQEELLAPVLEKISSLNDASPTTLILSPEWPTRIKVANSPEVSLTAFLSCSGELPTGELVKTGQAISPWFVAPPDTPQKSGRLLRYPINRRIDPPFYPAAMLSVYYPPLTTQKILSHLRRSVKADFSQPEGTVIFVTNEDIRTKTRLWQYHNAKSRLDDKNIPVEMISSVTKPPSRILGIMAGTANLNTKRYASGLVPGAFADHLTSFAANFDTSDQTKLTQWLDAGAAASLGTVTEPYTIWTKFPEAAFFERYLRGNTLLEAMMQSLASPYQSLLVGDPLCRPWAAELENLELKTSWTGTTMTIQAIGVPKGSATSMHLFVDGVRVKGDGPQWTLEVDPESYGPEMDIILHARYLWAPPEVGSLQQRVTTPSTSELQLRGNEKSDHVSLKLKSKAPLMMIEIYRGNEIVYTASVSGKKPEFLLRLDQSGTGPVSLRARAVTQTGDFIWSNYLDLEPKPPKY